MKNIFYLIALFLGIACTQQPQNTIISNVNGYTFSNDELVEFSTLVFADGKVVEVGGTELNEKYEGVLIDGNGKTMLPGLIDAHGHVMNPWFSNNLR